MRKVEYAGYKLFKVHLLSATVLKDGLVKSECLISTPTNDTDWWIDCQVFNVIFNIIKVIQGLPMHFSMLAKNSFYQYSA